MTLRLLLLVALTSVAVLPAQLRINELFTGSPDYLELRNLSRVSFDASGWSIETFFDMGSGVTADVSFTLPAGTTVSGRDTLVLEENGTAGAAGTLPKSISTGANFFWIDNRNTIVILRDDTGAAVDYLFSDAFGTGGAPNLPANLIWNGSVGDPATDLVQRIQVHDTNNASDWRATGMMSPGAENSGQYNNGTDHRGLMITEVSWGNPDGLEITNFSNNSLDLSNYTVIWDDGSVTQSGGLNVVLDSGESVVLVEDGGSFLETPPGVTVLESFPGVLFTSNASLSVALIDPAGIAVDEVRISDGTGGGTPANLGGNFRGMAVRGVISAPNGASGSVERHWGYDTNLGSDWTDQRSTSMGLINRNSGPEGMPAATPVLLKINEIDANPDYIEIFNAGTRTADLGSWFLSTIGVEETGFSIDADVDYPFPPGFLLAPGQFVVVGENGTPPAELPAGVSFFQTEGNLFFSESRALSVALHAPLGVTADMVSVGRPNSRGVQANPRLPAPPLAFTGAAPNGSGAAGTARVGFGDTDTGGDWATSVVRSMGSPNVSGTGGLAGIPSTTDVRYALTAAGPGSQALIINGGAPAASGFYQLVVSFQRTEGRGPFFGLGADALAILPTVLNVPPFAGPLDAEGSARFDLFTGLLPTGFDVEIFVVVSNSVGAVIDVTPTYSYRG